MNYGSSHSQLSVIIISYNQFEKTTGPCLDSLSENGCRDLEIIVVDNNSTDGAAESLQKYARSHPNVIIQLNRENRGFAGGNNDGVRLASGEVIVLLNSDTLVPAGAIESLALKLEEHQELSMVGPMTNEAGNEQRICITATGAREIMAEGRTWCSHAAGSYFLTESLVFFCVAMRRDLYLRLDGLDERYGLGFYEDADFCARILALGGTLMVAEDVFVYHQGSASFSADPQKTRMLLRKNEKIFRRKNPGVPKLKHTREKIFEVMENYLPLPEGAKAREDARYRFENRMRLARQLTPNNFLKRLVYQNRLQKLAKKFQLQLNG